MAGDAQVRIGVAADLEARLEGGGDDAEGDAVVGAKYRLRRKAAGAEDAQRLVEAEFSKSQAALGVVSTSVGSIFSCCIASR